MTDTLQQPGLNSLSKSFEPAALEAHWGPEWEKRGYGVAGYRGTSAPNAEAAARGDNFCIQLPPPNVTGTLPMGPAFNQTIMDSLTRYHRMRGFNTAWIPGTDHAGRRWAAWGCAMAVSYTHLDVYKRQRRHCPACLRAPGRARERRARGRDR